MTEKLGYLLQYHLHFVYFAGFDAIEHDHEVRSTIPIHMQLCLIFSKMLKSLAFNFELLIQLAVFLKWVEASTNCQFICAKLFCGDFILTSHLVYQQYALVPSRLV